jgi:hypothetical protein
MHASDSSDDELPPLAVPLTARPSKNDAHQSLITSQTAFPQQLGQVPVTLITGFLGAGKSTLINHILTSKHGYRCAVLLNEIGDSADIESALIKEPEVSLQGGATAHLKRNSVPSTVGPYTCLDMSRPATAAAGRRGVCAGQLGAAGERLHLLQRQE